MKRVNAFVAVFSLIIFLVLPVYAGETSEKYLDLAKASDELTSQDVYAYLLEQTVVTVSRREQKISEAPASVTVITAEDIKRSGALNIQDLLRPVAGLDVAGTTQNNMAISMRGFNTALASRTILVLLNGNPIYQDVNMSPMWSAIPVTLREIERIEIVRGPGSALWGANAFSGVLNIITKSIDKSPALRVEQSVGDRGTLNTNVTHAHKTGNLHYRLQFENDSMRNVALNTKDFSVKGNIYKLDLQYILNNQRELSLAFGYTDQPIYTVLDPSFFLLEYKALKELFHFTYKSGSKWLKIRQNFTRIDDLRVGVPYQAAHHHVDVDKSISIEAQDTKKFQRLGILTYGTEYKFVEAVCMAPQRSQGLGSVFAQHDISLNNRLSLIMGARADTHPQVKTAFSPRVSLMYAPSTGHSLRLTGATSYRRPASVELYANTLLAGLPLLGDEKIKAERIQSAEFSYRLKVTEKTKTSLTFFRSILDNFIGLTFSDGKLIFINNNKATQNGAEWELETFLTNNLKGFVNYAFNQTKNTQTGGPFEMSPKHKVNTGLGWMPRNGLYGNLLFNYVDDTGQTLGPQGFKRVEPYRTMDVNFGYRFNRKLEGLELALGARNVFNKKHKEQPAGDTFKRRVVGTISYAF